MACRKCGYPTPPQPQRMNKALFWVLPLGVILVVAASRQLHGLGCHPDIPTAAAAVDFARGSTVTLDEGAALQLDAAAGDAAIQGMGPSQGEFDTAAVDERQPAAGGQQQQPAAAGERQPAASRIEQPAAVGEKEQAAGGDQPAGVTQQQPAAVGAQDTVSEGQEQPAAVGLKQPAAVGQEQRAAVGQQQPAGEGQEQEPGGGESVKQWAAAGGKAPRDFLAPQSRCAVRADGSVMLPGDPLASGLPFLFDVATMPRREVACGHCASGKQEVNCCGVCQFEKDLCGTLYPRQNKTEALAERLIRRGLGVQSFTPCELFQRIRGRTLWFMGDSQMWGFYHAAECFLREFAPSLQRTPAVAPKHNLKLKMLQWVGAPMCLNLVHGTRVCVVRVDHASDTLHKVLPRLAVLVPKFADDVLVYSVGLHYPDYDLPEAPGPRYVAELTALATWRQRYKARLPHFVWVDTAPQHFATHEGTFPGYGHRPFVCQRLKAWYDGDPSVTAGTRRNIAVAPIIPRLADAHLRIYNATVPLWDVHLLGECSHYCQPSGYHMWLFMLNDVLRDSRLGSAVRVEGAQ